MKKQIVKIGEGIERAAWYSDSGNYRVLDAKLLGYWTPNRYVVQVLWINEGGQEIWMCCRHCGAILGAKSIKRAQELADSAEKDGVTWHKVTS